MLKKKVVALFLVVACLMSVQMPAFAAKKPAKDAVLEQVYTQIESRVSNDTYYVSDSSEPTDAQYDFIEAKVAIANRQIEHMVWVAQKTPQNDVDKLLAQVDRIVANVTRQAARYGIEIACEYTEYIVDGQVVLVDPLRVVNRR